MDDFNPGVTCHASAPKLPKTKERPADACPVANADCAKCHMPKGFSRL